MPLRDSFREKENMKEEEYIIQWTRTCSHDLDRLPRIYMLDYLSRVVD